MKFVVEHAHSPKFNGDGSIDLMVKFEHFREEVPFTARATDQMEHGRLIHAAAKAKKFGKVAAYVAPSAEEVARREKPRRMQRAMEMVNHYSMLDDSVMVQKWKQYYAEVHSGEVSPVEPE